jgi:acyl-CoA thioesterase-1
VAPQDAYPAQLERALRARGIDASVENAGRNGDTTTGVLARLDASVPSETDVAVVSVGVNDVAVHGVPAETSKANVREIAQRLRARGIEVVVLRTGGKFQGVLAARPEYHVEKGFGPPPGTTEWHLNAQGYAIVAERTLPRVLAAIEKARERRGP